MRVMRSHDMMCLLPGFSLYFKTVRSIPNELIDTHKGTSNGSLNALSSLLIYSKSDVVLFHKYYIRQEP